MPYLPTIFTDQDLINKFSDIVQPQVKQGQTPSPAVDPNMLKSIASKMVDRLGRDISISVDKVGAPLYMRDLQSLEQFLDFLTVGQVKYAGQPIVNMQYDQLTPEAQAQYIAYKWKEGVHATPVVGVYKAGLVAYLKSLQGQAGDDEQGKLLTAAIGKIIDEANAELKTDINHEALKATTNQEATKVIVDDAILDTIDTTLSVENPMSPPKGNITVTPKDLKTKGSFYYWSQQLKLSKGGKVISSAEFTNENVCDLIRTLYTRANTYNFRRGAPEDKYYLQLMTDLAKQYQCNVSGATGTGAQTGTAQTGAGALSGPQTSYLLEELANSRPFNSQYISFSDIKEFLKNYEALANGTPGASTLGPQVSAAASSINQLIDVVQKSMAMQTDTINMHSIVMGQFPNLLSNRRSATQMINNLSDVVSRAGVLYRQMLLNYRNMLDPKDLNAMQQQVAPGGPLQDNEDHLRDAARQVQSEITQK